MTVEPWILVGGVLAVIAAGALVQRALDRKRREAYTEYCLIRGYSYEPQRPGGEQRFRDAFEPFQKGNTKSWRNAITGTKNHAPFTAFEYVWHTGAGRNRHKHVVSGVVWERDGTPFPTFSLLPEGWFSRLGDFFAKRDIDFLDSPEFSAAYQLKGPDEDAIRRLFTPEIRHFFAATPQQKVTGGGSFLIWWSASALPKAERLDEWLEQGDHVRRRFFAT